MKAQIIHIRHTKQFLEKSLRWISAIECSSFSHVRPGYAIWHLCMNRPNGISLEELSTALRKGKPITAYTNKKDFEAAVKRWADYHIRVGRLEKRNNTYFAK